MNFSDALKAMEAGETVQTSGSTTGPRFKIIKDNIMYSSANSSHKVWAQAVQELSLMYRLDFEIVDDTEYFGYVQMCKKLLEGKRCRRKTWNKKGKGYWCYNRDQATIMEMDMCERNMPPFLNIEELEATDWYVAETTQD